MLKILSQRVKSCLPIGSSPKAYMFENSIVITITFSTNIEHLIANLKTYIDFHTFVCCIHTFKQRIQVF